MPKDVDESKIYKFESGGILPSNPEETIYIPGLEKTFKAEKINSIDLGLVDFIYDILKYNNQFLCLTEDIIHLTTDKHLELYNEIGICYNTEIYYLISQNNLSKNIISRTLNESSSAWHFVSCIFRWNNFWEINKKLDNKLLLKICQNLRIIIIGAYDGEGYIFWEKN